MTEPEVLTIDRPLPGVAVVTLARPEARNALDRRLRRDLHAALCQLDADPDIAAVVLTGADPAFCAGLDLKELAAETIESSGLDDAVVSRPDRRAGPIPEMDTPLIGAVNGVAITGGLELALACDFLVASDRARFADTHARVGILPGWGLTVRLPEAVGVRRAREMSITGNFVDADTALAWGLVNRVVAHDLLLATAVGLAADVAGNDGEAVGALLGLYRHGASLSRDEALADEVDRSRQWLAARAGQDLDARRRAVVERGRGQL